MSTATDQKTTLIAPYGLKSPDQAYHPNPTQTKVLNWVDNVRAGGYTKKGIPVLYLQGGVGCIAKDNQVLMADGSLKNIQDVKRGDYIVTLKGKRFESARVEARQFSGKKQCFAYEDSSGQRLVCTPDHKIIHKTAKKRKWEPISEMVKGYYGRNQIVSFDKWDLPDYMMTDKEIVFLAYMLTDGSFGIKGQSPKFTNIRLEYLNEVAQIYTGIFNKEAKWYKKGNGYDLLLTGRKGVKNDVNIYLNHQKDAFQYFSLRQLGLFFNRVISGDGTIYFKNRQNRNTPIMKVCIYTGLSAHLTKRFCDALRRMGVIARVFARKRTDNINWEIHINGIDNLKRLFTYTGLIFGKEKKSLEILDFLGKSKQIVTRFTQNSNFRLSSLTKSINAGVQQTYDLTIEGSNNFIVEGVVVHNSGKSRALLAPVIEMLLEIPLLRILWGRNDFKDIKLSIMDKFFEILPNELIKSKSEQYHWYDIAQDGGGHSRIYFNGLKDLSGFSSQEFGIIVITEVYEITEQAYRTLKRRLRQEGVPVMILMEGEAPNEDHWLAKLTDPDCQDFDPDIEMWMLDTHENWDNLPEAYRDSLETMPESWKKKYLMGQYGFIPDGDPFYQGFKEVIHKKVLTVLGGRELLLGWDYGYRHPACAITQMDSKGRWCLLREVIGTNITITQFADVMKSYLNVHFPLQSAISYGDPAGKQVNDKSERTSEEILRSKGFNIFSRVSTYRDRKEIIEGKLSTLIEGTPALVIDPACKTIIDGFLGGYHYPMIKQGQQYTAVKTEQPYRDGYYEHIMNAMEYIAVNVFKPIPRSKKNAGKRRARRYELSTRKNGGMRFG